MSTGLLDAGIQVSLGTDYYAPAMRTFAYNHSYRNVRPLTSDIRLLSADQILAHANISRGNLQLLAGGPPCQPFSIIGKRQGLEDPRGDLVFQFVRMLRELEPETFIFENVANLASGSNGAVLNILLEEMTNAGYATSYAVLHAADYGVAQMRKRLIIIGVRGKEALPFPPNPSHGTRLLLGEMPYRTCRDVLDSLPDVEDEQAAFIPNHEPTDHSSAMIAAFEQLAPGTRDPKSHHDRLHPNRPSYTLRAGSGNFSPLRPVHYKYNRVITVRESARIQGFSDSFIWPPEIPRLQQYRQVGNAVPPLLAKVVALHIANIMGWKLDPEITVGDIQQREIVEFPSIIERNKERRKRIRGASIGRMVD
ncbi:MAG: DNA cytosine methyltransferase [Oscillochloris sp.]|nr:DNA cytosine methyltransferase [Oscillochloris sp.]